MGQQEYKTLLFGSFHVVSCPCFRPLLANPVNFKNLFPNKNEVKYFVIYLYVIHTDTRDLLLSAI